MPTRASPLAILLVLYSAIAAYVYLRIVVVMYMQAPKEDALPAFGAGIACILAIAAAGVLGFGLFPGPLAAALAEAASRL